MTGTRKTTMRLSVHYCFIQGDFWMSSSVIIGFAAAYLQSKQIDNTQIGIILALAYILSIILQQMMAAAADKHKRLPLKIMTAGLMAAVVSLSILLAGCTDSEKLIAVLFILVCTLHLSIVPLINSLALQFVDRGIPVNFSVARGMGSVFYGIISFIVGYLVQRDGAAVIVPVFAVIYGILLVLTLTFPSPSPQMGKSEEGIGGRSQKIKGESFIAFFVRYKLFFVLLAGVTLQFITFNATCTYMINILRAVGGDSADLGLSNGLGALSELPTFLLFNYLVRKIRCSTLLKIAAFFFVVKFIVLLLATGVAMILFAQGLQMVTFALFIPASVYYVNERMDSENKVKGQALMTAAYIGVSGTIGDFAGGQMIDKLGVQAMLQAGVALSILGLALIVIGAKDTADLRVSKALKAEGSCCHE